MSTRRCALVIAGMLAVLVTAAHADPKAEIVAKTRSAMASYDAMDYDAARRQLNQAIAVAKKAKLDRDPVVARVYLDLGIAQLAGSDPEAARGSFLTAVQIDPKIAVDPGYKTSELVRMVDEAKLAARKQPAAGQAGGDEPESDGVDCAAVRGLQHTVIETGRPGIAQPIEATVNSELSPARVVVMYRPEGAVDFTEAKLTKQGACRYVGTIPASAMHGGIVHYYIVAYDVASKALAAKGTSGSPNLISLGGAGVPRVTEEPISAGTSSKVPTIASQAPDPADRPPSHSSIELSIHVGTGLGYVTGVTEAGNNVQTCCIGTSLLVFSPEVAYYFSRQFGIGLAARIGVPIGANIDGHSTAAPAGFLRFHYAFSRSGDGLALMGEVGVGVLRNTLKVNAVDDMPGMDTDVVAQGPLLLGLGLGYKKHLGGALAFLAELDAMSGLAVADKLGSAIYLNTGFSADVTLGLAVGF
ncbi:MAG TPA: tetratricopeptide repeat protein [Kofleriaceae bacterium]